LKEVTITYHWWAVGKKLIHLCFKLYIAFIIPFIIKPLIPEFYYWGRIRDHIKTVLDTRRNLFQQRKKS